MQKINKNKRADPKWENTLNNTSRATSRHVNVFIHRTFDFIHSLKIPQDI